MKDKRKIIIHWSAKDNAFIAEVPELPGCAADGRTAVVGVCEGGNRSAKNPHEQENAPDR